MGCPEFDAEVDHESLWGDGKQLTGNTYVYCEHRKRCQKIVAHLKEKMKILEDKEGPNT